MKKVRIRIRGLGYNEYRSFEILDRQKLNDIIEELDSREIFRKTYEKAQGYSFSGTAYTYIDARGGEIVTSWIQQNNFLHPFDSFYEITLCSIDTPVEDFTHEDLLDPNDEEYQEFIEQNELGIEEFIEKKYGKKELNERIENAIEWYAEDFLIDWIIVKEQLKELYSKTERENVTDKMLEIIEQTGRIPVSVIDNLESVIKELKSIGYIAYLDKTTDYLIVEQG